MKRAVDIALIPPPEIIDLVLEINQKAVQNGTARIKLGKTDRIPHISLLMGILDDSHVDAAVQKLETISKNTEPISLIVEKIAEQSFQFQKNETLQQLHETCIELIDPLLTHEKSADYYEEEDKSTVVESTQLWPHAFVPHHSFEKFVPHITIHSPDTDPAELPISFTTNTLGLYHLGAYNTCRTKLAEFTLS